MHNHRQRHHADPHSLPYPFPSVHIRVDGLSPHYVVHAPCVVIYNYQVPAPLHHPPPPRPPQQHHRGPIPRPAQPIPRSPGNRPRNAHPVHVPRRHMRVELPKRVRFDLPAKNGEDRRHARRRDSDPDLKRPFTPANKREKPPVLHRNPSYDDLRRPPSSPHLGRHPPQYDISYRYIAPRHVPLPLSPRRPAVPAKSTVPTIHILTYALESTRRPLDAQSILAPYLPPGTPHLYDIPAWTFTPPPSDLCLLYSGASPIIQDYVMRDPRARRAVRHAVSDLLDFRKREKQRERDGRSWKKEVAISVCCQFGTHRSVSVAERIAEGVRDAVARKGVRVKVVHLHRRRYPRDPW